MSVRLNSNVLIKCENHLFDGLDWMFSLLDWPTEMIDLGLKYLDSGGPMKIFWCLVASFVSISVFAKSSKECQELKSEQIRLALTGANLANLNSTHTPEGGPYRPYIVKSCSNGGCDVKRDDRAPLMKYLPDHPDADRNGYVAFPNIDQKSEYATFNMTAMKLKLLALGKTCGAKVIIDNASSSFALRYQGKGSEAKEDIFNLNSQHQVISWMRQDFNGASNTSNFRADAEVVFYR